MQSQYVGTQSQSSLQTLDLALSIRVLAAIVLTGIYDVDTVWATNDIQDSSLHTCYHLLP